ncbi:O-antigen ligase family protein [Roseovarius sp. D22-M7]|uniref:O-antigen ligase family protein n=1 Tax=Roseovarius sp. D22-M7 TaxID=3127116 RepID=UPI00300FB17D
MVNTMVSREFNTARELKHISTDSANLSLVVVFYLISIVIPVSFNIGGLNITPVRLYLMPVIVYLVWGLLTGKYGKFLPVDVLFFCHFFWIIVALGVNNPSKAISQFGSVGVEFLGAYLIGRILVQNAETFAKLSRLIVLLILFTVPFAMIEAFTGRSLLIDLFKTVPGVNAVSYAVSEARFGLNRAQVLFDHPIHYGLFCSIAMSLAFVALKDHTSPTKRYVSSSVVMIGGFFSLSSGALLAIVLQLFLVVWATLFDKIRWRWWLLFGLMCFAYILVDILSNRSPVLAVLSRLAFSEHNLYIRTFIFDYGMDNVLGNPIFGIGLNDWARPHWLPPSIDNFWLVMAVRYGITGFLFLAAGYIYGLVKIMARDFDADRSLFNFRRAWVFTFIGLSFTLATVHVWTSIYSFVFFMFGAGMWLITAAPERDKTAQASDRIGSERKSLPYTRFPVTRDNRITS